MPENLFNLLNTDASILHCSQLAQKGMLCNLLEAVAYLHTRNLVHRDVRPANISWFESSARWRLSVPSAWAKRAADAPITYNLRYAAPEV